MDFVAYFRFYLSVFEQRYLLIITDVHIERKGLQKHHKAGLLCCIHYVKYLIL